MAPSFDNETPKVRHESDAWRQSAYFIDGGVMDLGRAALRRCCKMMKLASDKERVSIFFCSEDQANATPYLLKLPNLTSVSVQFQAPDKEPVVHRCLRILFTTKPQLSGLVLHHKYDTTSTPPPTPSQKLLASIGSQVIQWRSTLQHLTINNFDCKGIKRTSRAAQNASGLDFLPQLQALLTLQLHQVKPSLTTKNIRGCTSLWKISLKGAHKVGSLHLDLSSCCSLQAVSITNYGLQGLCVSGLPELRFLRCCSNSLEQLNLSGCTALARCDCSMNCLTDLDITQNLHLEELNCNSNLISQLDLAGSLRLTSLMCKKCMINELSLLACTGLHTLICDQARIFTEELQACPGLRCLHMVGNSSNSGLILANLPGLESLHIRNSGLTSLDVRDCTRLTQLVSDNNPNLATLLASGCSSLVRVIMLRCGVQALNLAGCSKIDHLDCSSSPHLTVLNLASCASLRKVRCEKTKLTTLDVSRSARSLTSLTCRGSAELDRLRISGCSKLSQLDCTGCLLLQSVECWGCSLNTQLLFKKAGLFDGMNMGQVLAMDV